MRVLQVGPYSPPHGGIQGHVVALRAFLQEKGIRCDVIDLNKQRRTDRQGVFGPRNALHLLWLLVRLDANIVHLHIGGNLTLRLLLLGLICTCLPRRKSVLTFHSGGYAFSPHGRNAGRFTVRGAVLRRFDRVIGVNEQIIEVFQRYGLLRNCISLIPPHYLPAEPPTIDLPEPLKSFYASHTPVLLSVGLLEPEYDLKLQIEVLGLIRKSFPSAGLVFIGSGSLESELRALIDQKSYSNDVLLCGDVARTITLRAIADSNVFLRTTLFDGDSISVREALHFGVPAIASDSVPRPDNTCLFQTGDIDDLGSQIIEGIGKNKGERPSPEPFEQNLKAVLELYRELCGIQC